MGKYIETKSLPKQARKWGRELPKEQYSELIELLNKVAKLLDKCEEKLASVNDRKSNEIRREILGISYQS